MIFASSFYVLFSIGVSAVLTTSCMKLYDLDGRHWQVFLNIVFFLIWPMIMGGVISVLLLNELPL